MTQKYDIALLGLGVMGQSLARNIASRGVNTLTWNRHSETAQAFIKQYGNAHLDYRKDLKDICKELKSPRQIILMVPAGKPVDDMIKALKPHLKKGDTIVDAGNSLYKDTIRRSHELESEGFHFVGMGVSGGEEGALRGPSIMPGGSKESWKALSPILKKIAAKDFNGKPCVTHVGSDGAGHYVKMVHNGIEYGIMQMMAEAYQILRHTYKLKPLAIAKIFKKYGRGRLRSFLFDIAVPVLEQEDEFNKRQLIDFILDKAGQKGTGRWVALDALERGANLPTITMSVFARNISSQKEKRADLAKSYKIIRKKPSIPLEKFIKLLEGALYAGMISSYAQGFDLIRMAADEEGWKLNFAEITRIWEGGCIIRADMLAFLHKAFLENKSGKIHLLEMESIRKALKKDLNAWRRVVSLGIETGIAVHCLGSSLTYFDGMTTEKGSANMIQGLRDFFGAHTYERVDKKGTFHTPWSNLEI